MVDLGVVGEVVITVDLGVDLGAPKLVVFLVAIGQLGLLVGVLTLEYVFFEF